MMPVKSVGIAVIGDQDLVGMMRLAGISRYYLVLPGEDRVKNLRQALEDIANQSDIGIILLMEEYAEDVSDIIAHIQENRRLTPVIVEVPSQHGTKYGNARDFYKAFIQKFIGFEIEI